MYTVRLLPGRQVHRCSRSPSSKVVHHARIRVSRWPACMHAASSGTAPNWHFPMRHLVSEHIPANRRVLTSVHCPLSAHCTPVAFHYRHSRRLLRKRAIGMIAWLLSLSRATSSSVDPVAVERCCNIMPRPCGRCRSQRVVYSRSRVAFAGAALDDELVLRSWL